MLHWDRWDVRSGEDGAGHSAGQKEGEQCSLLTLLLRGSSVGPSHSGGVSDKGKEIKFLDVY